MKYYFGFICACVFYAAHAEDVQVQINGAVLAQSCNVKSTDLNKNVIFDDIDPQVFTSIGSTSDAKKVSIALENCTGNVAAMSYMFSGTGDDTYPELLKVTGQSGSASEGIARGLALEILDANSKPVSLNKQTSFPVTITTSDYIFNFYLRYKSTSLTVDSGDASSILYLDFYYE